MPLFINTIEPELEIQGPDQQFIFNQNTCSFQTHSTFVPTSVIPSQINIMTTNNTFSGFRWVHTTNQGDTFGQLKLQSFVNNSTTGTDIMTFTQSGNIEFNSSIVIHVPPVIEVDGVSQTFQYNGDSNANFILNNTFAASVGNPSFIDLSFINSFNRGFRVRAISNTTDTIQSGNLTFDYLTNAGTFQNLVTLRGEGNVVLNDANSGNATLTINTNQIAAGGIVISNTNLSSTFNGILLLSNSAIVATMAYNAVTSTLGLVAAGLAPSCQVGVTANLLTITNSNSQFVKPVKITNQISIPHLELITASATAVGIRFTNDNATSPFYGLEFGDSGGVAHAQISYNRASGELNVRSLSYGSISPTCTIGTSISTLSFTQTNASFNKNLGLGGLTTPNAPLQFQNSATSTNRIIVLNEVANNDHQYTGFGYNVLGVPPGVLRYQIAGTAYSHQWFAATSSTTSNQLMILDGTGNLNVSGNLTVFGNIGIATFPNALFQLPNNVINKMFVLNEVANNNHQFFGFGINTDIGAGTGTILRYQVASTTHSHQWFAGTSFNTSNQLMVLDGTGTLYVKKCFISATLGTGTFALTAGTTTLIGAGASSALNFTVNSSNQFSYINSGSNKGYLQYNGTAISSINALITFTINCGFSTSTGTYDVSIYKNGSLLTTCVPSRSNIVTGGSTVSVFIPNPKN